jgi:peptidoglycan/xylan/chitin deacetylase (PgdA/CDA1 family)
VAALALVVVTGACSDEEASAPTGRTTSIDMTTTSIPSVTSTVPTAVDTSPPKPSSTSSTSSTTAVLVTATSSSTTVSAVTTTSSSTTVSAVTTTPTPSIATTTVPIGPASIASYRLPTDERTVALTFDAGSDLGNTATILDVLARYGVRASFGITGAFAEAHPDHIRRMAREGHVVINHSYSHFSFTGVSSTDVLLDRASRQDDLLRADAVLSSLTGASSAPFWRPPFGDYDQSVLDDVGAIGYRYTVLWTIDSLGWRGLTAGEIVDRVLDLVEPGAIVVMHVGSQSADADALPSILDGLVDAGYSFTTVEALDM